ncbi:MAG TPA: hypothetical protein VJJ46_08340 [Anaerolineales bacterium]|nr:hypothetical protein [Anaerolineales bacterium]
MRLLSLLAAISLAAGLLACNLPVARSPAPGAVTSPTPPPAIATARTPRPPSSPIPTAEPSVGALAETVDAFLARCPTAEEIASVDADLVLTFEQDPTAGALSCQAEDGSADLTLLQQRGYQAVVLLRLIPFDAPLPWTNLELYAWFTSTVNGIRFRGDIEISSCCDSGGVMSIQTRNLAALTTDDWIDPAGAAGMADLVVLFVHEARHNEGYSHTCGPDDNTMGEMGAWAVQAYLWDWLADHADPAFLTPDEGPANRYRELARWAAYDIRGSRFCQEPPPPSPQPIS